MLPRDSFRRCTLGLAVLACLALPPAARAGPPYQTDDPEPTDTGHWEIYAPTLEGEGTARRFAGSTGAELNYGAAPRVQLSVGLPLAFARDGGSRIGAGDLALSVKYRFLADRRSGIALATFPAITLPTASAGLGAGRITGFIPVWAQQVAGPWTVFGGGGYALNPGSGNRDFWRFGLAATRTVSPRLELGGEVLRQGADTADGEASTRPGVGFVWHWRKPVSLIASGGPIVPDHGRVREARLFAALRLDY